MVEKSKVSQPSSETFVPSPSQLASIDTDGFEQTSFSSTQAPGKAQVYTCICCVLCYTLLSIISSPLINSALLDLYDRTLVHCIKLWKYC